MANSAQVRGSEACRGSGEWQNSWGSYQLDLGLVGDAPNHGPLARAGVWLKVRPPGQARAGEQQQRRCRPYHQVLGGVAAAGQVLLLLLPAPGGYGTQSTIS